MLVISRRLFVFLQQANRVTETLRMKLQKIVISRIAATLDQRIIDPPVERWHGCDQVRVGASAFSCRNTLDRVSKNISERSEKSSFQGPIGDCEYNVGK
jgi:hypothetical protein